ncbi:MAG: hypothetical protein ABH814_01665 [bacterium]
MPKDIKLEAKNFFSENKFVKCPAFPKSKIYFNSKSLNHLFYESPRSARNKKEITARVSLLPRAKKLLEVMPLAQEEDRYRRDGKLYQFWAFEAVVDGRRIKVIVRQIGSGRKHFWSVIPAWRKSRFGPRNSRKDLWK